MADGAFPTSTVFRIRPEGSRRKTLLVASLVTHKLPSATAGPGGAAPTGIGALTFPFVGSMRETVLSTPFATQIPPRPAVRARGPFPTGITWSLFVSVGIRDTVRS